MLEEWRTLPQFPNYRISNFGNIYSEHKNIVMSPKIDRYGYKCVGLYLPNHIVKHITVHRLVALAFIPNPMNKPQVNHINFNRQDNRVCNLEWVTSKENIHHTHNHGRNANIVGQNNPMAKLNPIEVWNIKFAYEGVSCYRLSKVLNIGDETIRRIRLGLSWANINYEDAGDLLLKYRDEFLGIRTK